MTSPHTRDLLNQLKSKCPEQEYMRLRLGVPDTSTRGVPKGPPPATRERSFSLVRACERAAMKKECADMVISWLVEVNSYYTFIVFNFVSSA